MVHVLSRDQRLNIPCWTNIRHVCRPCLHSLPISLSEKTCAVFPTYGFRGNAVAPVPSGGSGEFPPFRLRFWVKRPYHRRMPAQSRCRDPCVASLVVQSYAIVIHALSTTNHARVASRMARRSFFSFFATLHEITLPWMLKEDTAWGL